MVKRALMYATVASMIDLFNMENIKALQCLGYQVDVAANFEEGNVTSKERINSFKSELEKINVKYYHIPIPRSVGNIKALKKSLKFTMDLRDENNYDLVHCHTPIGSVLCRMVFRKSKAKVIYTAHGFHFFKGAPLKNWVLYYPVERYLSRYTDTLITINKEDYENSKKFHSKRNVYVPGVGIDLYKYSNKEKKQVKNLRLELGIKQSDIILFSTGELNKNKNHQVVIRSLAKLQDKRIHYVVAGQGPLKMKLDRLAKKLEINERLHLLGYRNDISELLQISDIFVFPSFREGLSASLMEAMAMGKPIIASDIRGNNDLIVQNFGGYLFNNKDLEMLSNYIEKLANNRENQICFGKYNIEKIQDYSSEKVLKQMMKIYN